jgi:hypothetical protein
MRAGVASSAHRERLRNSAQFGFVRREKRARRRIFFPALHAPFSAAAHPRRAAARARNASAHSLCVVRETPRKKHFPQNACIAARVVSRAMRRIVAASTPLASRHAGGRAARIFATRC